MRIEKDRKRLDIFVEDLRRSKQDRKRIQEDRNGQKGLKEN